MKYGYRLIPIAIGRIYADNLYTILGVLDKCIFESQVREQTQIWMDNYNNHRPHDGLGKVPPVKYAKINSFEASPKRIKNNNFIKVLES